MKSRESRQLTRISGQDPAALDDDDGFAPEVSYERSAAPSILATVARRTMQVLLPVMVIALAMATYNYLKSTKPEAGKRQLQEAIFSVRSIQVAFASHQPHLTLYGTTIAGREVELRSLVAGRVERTGPQLRAGGRIDAGEMLLEIDPFDYRVAIAEAKAQLAEARAKQVEMAASLQMEMGNHESAEAQLKLAETDLKRAQPLAKRGSVSERTVDERRLVVLQRNQAVTLSKNNIKVWAAREAQNIAAIARLETVLQRARKRLSETKLTAPFNAYVGDVGAQVGRMLNVNDRVATLIDRDWIDARFTLTDGQFGRITGGESGLIGRQVDVRWNAGRRALIYKAKIERIDGRVSADSGGVQVYARITTPSKPVAIRAGVFVEVRLPDATFECVAKVPSEAVYDGKSVYIIADGRLNKRNVAIVGTSGNDLLIEGNIKSGERIVITRLARPGNGVRVKERAS